MAAAATIAHITASMMVTIAATLGTRILSLAPALALPSATSAGRCATLGSSGSAVGVGAVYLLASVSLTTTDSSLATVVSVTARATVLATTFASTLGTARSASAVAATLALLISLRRTALTLGAAITRAVALLELLQALLTVIRLFRGLAVLPILSFVAVTRVLAVLTLGALLWIMAVVPILVLSLGFSGAWLLICFACLLFSAPVRLLLLALARTPPPFYSATAFPQLFACAFARRCAFELKTKAALWSLCGSGCLIAAFRPSSPASAACLIIFCGRGIIWARRRVSGIVGFRATAR